MPQNAINEGLVDHVVPVDEIAPRLLELIAQPAREPSQTAPPEQAEELEAARIDRDILYERQPGVPSDFTCPDCGGVLRFVPDKDAHHLRCQVGHAWNEQALLAAQVERVETSLWAAVRALEEHAKLTKRLRDDFRARHGARAVVQELEERLRESEHHAREIRKLLLHPIEDTSAPAREEVK